MWLLNAWTEFAEKLWGGQSVCDMHVVMHITQI